MVFRQYASGYGILKCTWSSGIFRAVDTLPTHMCNRIYVFQRALKIYYISSWRLPYGKDARYSPLCIWSTKDGRWVNTDLQSPHSQVTWSSGSPSTGIEPGSNSLESSSESGSEGDAEGDVEPRFFCSVIWDCRRDIFRFREPYVFCPGCC